MDHIQLEEVRGGPKSPDQDEEERAFRRGMARAERDEPDERAGQSPGPSIVRCSAA